MDLLERMVQSIKKKFCHQTLRRTLELYILSTIIIVVLLILITVTMCESFNKLIYDKYQIETNLREKQLLELIRVNADKKAVQEYILLESVYHMELSDTDQILVFFLEILQNFSGIFYSITAIIIVSKMYYKKKLEMPFELLMEETKHISRNDLNYECMYQSEDEMGEICHCFEQMRQQLIINQKNIWSLMEEQRRINIAFAHDLRTPLTVLRGYLDLLINYYPKGKISEEKLLETLQTMSRQIHRLDQFSKTMKQLTKFEEITAEPKLITMKQLRDALLENSLAIHTISNIKMNVTVKGKEEQSLFLDQNLVLEVAGNLISNAIRYAKEQIEVTIGYADQKLELYVKDDGRGFNKEELRLATKPYYNDKSDETEHFGIGLTICHILCEKQGGDLQLYNSIYGGAIVMAQFYAG